MDVALAKTPLYEWHVERNARVVDFAGWAMPVQYGSIVEEHRATRIAAGLLDISHMGRLRFDGSDAEAFLDRLLTRRVVGLAPSLVRYSLMTNEKGGILDDVLVYHMRSAGGESFYLLVVNASNREKIVSWIDAQRRDDEEIGFRDETREAAMLAVQGPNALATVEEALGLSIEPMKYYTAAVSEIGGQSAIVSRTGYTGEDGCELIVPADTAVSIANRLLSAGESCGLQPVGLGARDTLRLEAGMPLYGHELSEAINPYEAGLGFAVQLKDRAFVGSAALANQKTNEDLRERVGLQLDGKRVPRENYPVVLRDEIVGTVTSGTFSPTLERPIAMAYLRRDVAAVGTEVAVDIRGRPEPARVVKLPFYSRPAN
ncbi:MAG: glycine cleavage system protein T [Planctomycetaceae bacterium]|nr:glycine cleavage system protein T [Planctomycetaceae bacterium]